MEKAVPRGLAFWLAKRELLGRPRRYARLFVILAASTAGLFLILGLSSGLVDGLSRDVAGTLAGDVRFAKGSHEVAEGVEVPDAEIIVGSMESGTRGNVFAARYETQALFQHGADIERWRAGVLVGVDPEVDSAISDLPSRVIQGSYLPAEPIVQDFITYHPVLAGRDLIGALNVTPWQGSGAIGPQHILNATAGRNYASGSAITARLVIVGIYSTGLKLIDSRVVFAPIGTARILTGGFADDDTATAFVGRTGDSEGAVETARRMGFVATTGRDFAEDNLAALFGTVRLFVAVTGAMLVILAAAWATHVVSMMIFEDRRTIAYVRALGMGHGHVADTYTVIGGLIGVAGSITGLFLGLLIAYGVNATSPEERAVADLTLTVGIDWGAALLLFVVMTLATLLAVRFQVRGLREEGIAEMLREA